MKHLYIFIFFFGLMSNVQAQVIDGSYDINILMECDDDENLTVSGEQMFADINQNVCVPFKARNFTNIAAFQLGVTWDANVISYTNFIEGNLPDKIDFNPDTAADGILNMVWSPLTEPIILEGHDLEDETVLFEVCFDVIGLAGESSPITYDESGALVPEFTQVGPNEEDIKVVDLCLAPGLITVNAEPQSLSFKATLNNQDVIFDQFGISPISQELIKEGTNTINFEIIGFENYIENISTLDLVIGLKMFVLDAPIDPIQAIALDVDYSGGINVKDLVLIRQLILGLRNDLPHPGYFFVERNQVFDNSFDPFSFGYFDQYTFDKGENRDRLLSFKSFKYGDLSRTLFHSPETEVRSSVENLTFENKYIPANQATSVKFSIVGDSDFEINAFQSSLVIDEGIVNEINHNYSGSSFLSHSPEDGIINLLYANEESIEEIEFELVIESEIPGFLSDKLSLNDQFQIELVKDDLNTSKLKLNAQEVVSKEFNITPNPFNLSTKLDIPRAYIGGELIVTNLLGRSIYNSQITNGEITLDRSVLASPGVYFVTLESGSRAMTRRLVLQE